MRSRFALVLGVTASLVAAFGAFVLPRAGTGELPRALPGERSPAVLVSQPLAEDGGTCPWLRARAAARAVELARQT